MPNHIRSMPPNAHIRQRQMDNNCDCMKEHSIFSECYWKCKLGSKEGFNMKKQSVGGWIIGLIVTLILVLGVLMALQHYNKVDIGFVKKMLEFLPKGTMKAPPSSHLQYFFF